MLGCMPVIGLVVSSWFFDDDALLKMLRISSRCSRLMMLCMSENIFFLAWGCLLLSYLIFLCCGDTTHILTRDIFSLCKIRKYLARDTRVLHIGLSILRPKCSLLKMCLLGDASLSHMVVRPLSPLFHVCEISPSGSLQE